MANNILTEINTEWQQQQQQQAFDTDMIKQLIVFSEIGKKVINQFGKQFCERKVSIEDKTIAVSIEDKMIEVYTVPI